MKKTGPKKRRNKRKRSKGLLLPKSNYRKVLSHFQDNYRKSCQSKVRHEYEYEAKNHMLELRAKGDHSPLLTTYPCPYCGGWHVGHKRPERKE